MTRYIYKSAITGRIVSRAYAEAHPDTTFKQEVGVVRSRPAGAAEAEPRPKA